MDAIQTQCPMCHSMFKVPARYANRRARCKKCGQEFRIKSPCLDDTVLDWLSTGSQELAADPAVAAALGAGGNTKATRAAGGAYVSAPPAAPSPTTPAAPAASTAARAAARLSPGDSMIAELDMEETLGGPKPEDCLKLSHIDELGAFVLFPSMLLHNAEFRASIPRCCLSCGSTHHLRIHLVHWQSVRDDGRQQAKDAEPIKSSMRADSYMAMSDAELVAALPTVPNKPAPFNLPMPYYICERCSPVGTIMTHVRTTVSGREVCEIGINSLARAAQFVARNLGRDSEDFKRLDKAILGGGDNPWKALPLSVRNRIERWFKIEKGETFHAYLLDHDFAKAEGGLGGLVVTDKRIIFHKFAGHREFDLQHALTLQTVDKPGQFQLHILDAESKPAVLHCDQVTVDKIKQLLVSLNVKYKFVKD